MFIKPPFDDTPEITAYLTADLTPTQLSTLRATFERGAYITTNPLNRIHLLRIESHPENLSISHLDIVRAHRAATEPDDWDPFLIIDQHAFDKGAMWYVELSLLCDGDPDELDLDVESVDQPWKILIKTEQISNAACLYLVGKRSLSEDLYGQIKFPAPIDYAQLEPYDCDVGVNLLEPEEVMEDLEITVYAAPGEFEETSDAEVLDTYFTETGTRATSLARVTEDVARDAGVEAVWNVSTPSTKWIRLADGSKQRFADGTVILRTYFASLDVMRGYTLPEGSS